MGSRFRERVLSKLRELFFVDGYNSRGFKVRPRLEDSWELARRWGGREQIVSSMSLTQCRAAGFEVYGDACITVSVFPDLKTAQFSDFCAAMVILEFRDDPERPFFVRYRKKLRRGWADLRFGTHPQPIFMAGMSVGRPREACLIQSDGNTVSYAIVAGQFALFTYHTS